MCIEEHVITQNWTFRETMTTAGSTNGSSTPQSNEILHAKSKIEF